MQFTDAQLALINDCGTYTHTLWAMGKVQEVENLFPGIKVHSWKQQTENHYKGAHLSNGVQEAMVTDSECILEAVAKWANYQFGNAMNYEGRGSRVNAMARELVALQEVPAC
jgi:hypothetical protein